jgi:hypothetical protein
MPAVDLQMLFEMAQDPMSAMEMVAPWIRAPLEAKVFNKSFYYRKQLYQYPGHKERFLWWQMDPRNVHLMRSMRWMSTFDRWAKHLPEGWRPERDPDRGGGVEITAAEEILRHMTGVRSFSIDRERMANQWAYVRKRNIRELERQMRLAAIRGDWESVDKIRDIIFRSEDPSVVPRPAIFPTPARP